MTGGARPGPSDTARSYLVLVGAAALAGLVIAGAVTATAPRIAANQAAQLADAIARIMPGVTSWNELAVVDGRLEPASVQHPASVFALRDVRGGLLGFAIKAQVMGYQDRIQALYGYDPVAQRVVGLEILASLETPGLGSRIATDPHFLDNFRALDVRLAGGGHGLAQPIVVVPEGRREQPWEIDAITGATVSSRAVATLLNVSAERVLPILHADLERLGRG